MGDRVTFKLGLLVYLPMTSGYKPGEEGVRNPDQRLPRGAEPATTMTQPSVM